MRAVDGRKFDLQARQLKHVRSGVVVQTLPRGELVAVQTPQAMRRDWLEEDFARCRFPPEQITDDVQVLELAGRELRVVEGDSQNLKVTVPAGALTGPVALTNGTETTTIVAILKIAPRIDDFTPGEVVGGSDDLVTVNGTNLRAATGEPAVKVGTTPVPASLIQSSTPTQLVFKVPLGAVTAKISVTTAGGTGTSPSTLTVRQPPRIKSFSPASGAVGTTVTMSGTNLQGVTEVTFAGGVTAAPIGTPTATSLKVTVPDGAATSA